MNTIHLSWQPLFEKYKTEISMVEKMYKNQNTDDNTNNKNTNKIFPPKEQLFRVFEMDVKEIQVVLLGQDPYHKEGQAHGLSFSVSSDTKIPPSLRNIFKELKLEFPERGYAFVSGNLDRWFYQEKIFLLNSSLSVLEGTPGSHMKIWEPFTNDIIRFISEQNTKCVFLLLGNFAKQKEKFINTMLSKNSRIVTGVHPSPLAQGFIGSHVFLKVEELLGKEVNWSN
jgi:uracil-DNA glycosylase